MSAEVQAAKVAERDEHEKRVARESKDRARKESQVNPKRR